MQQVISAIAAILMLYAGIFSKVSSSECRRTRCCCCPRACPCCESCGGRYCCCPCLVLPALAVPEGVRWVNSIDPVGYLIRALFALHLRCDGGAAAGCVTIDYPTAQGLVPRDRSDLVATLYDVQYDAMWTNVGWLALFVPALFVLNALSLRFFRHIVR